MSPERKEYYARKQRRMAFYIVENNVRNEETPPEMSAVIGTEKLSLGSRLSIVRDNEVTATIKKKPIPAQKRYNQIHCPSLPTQWRNSVVPVVPKAVFSHEISHPIMYH
jgi:hypothetical protein